MLAAQRLPALNPIIFACACVCVLDKRTAHRRAGRWRKHDWREQQHVKLQHHLIPKGHAGGSRYTTSPPSQRSCAETFLITEQTSHCHTTYIIKPLCLLKLLTSSCESLVINTFLAAWWRGKRKWVELKRNMRDKREIKDAPPANESTVFGGDGVNTFALHAKDSHIGTGVRHKRSLTGERAPWIQLL